MQQRPTIGRSRRDSLEIVAQPRRARIGRPGYIGAVILAFACLGAATPAPGAADSDSASDIVDMPVSFQVQNLDRSRAMTAICTPDGRTHQLKGHLVGTWSSLAGPAPRAVTLYIHGGVTGEPIWRFKAVPGYDYAFEEARAGHTSVTVDQLGSGSSDIPDGQAVCVGSQADIAHQVIGALRSGGYMSTAAHSPTFQRVALAGHSLGGLIAQIEAYSFQDVDALVIMDSALELGFSTWGATQLIDPVRVCATGGEPKQPGGPPGYAYVFKGTEADLLGPNADPAVVAAVEQAHERDACGAVTSVGGGIAADHVYLRTITIPVLVVFGDQDKAFRPGTGEREARQYTGSRDVTYVAIRNAGHPPMLSRSALVFRAKVSSWLARHGF